MTPVVMIAGDGIGPEVMAATQQILAAAEAFGASSAARTG